MNPRLLLFYFSIMELAILDVTAKNVSGNGNEVLIDVNLLYTLKLKLKLFRLLGFLKTTPENL